MDSNEPPRIDLAPVVADSEPAAPPTNSKLRRFMRRLLKAFGIFLLLALIAGAGYAYWYTHRPAPPAVDKDLFEGVHNTR